MSTRAQFPGFTKQMPSFFRQLAKNNEREWFVAHRPQYETHVKGPMGELVAAVNEAVRAHSPFNAVENPVKAIYRIHRDTRFSRDKTPYKTHIGATFPRSGLPKHGGAGFYFGVSHEKVEIAGGVYMPGAEELAALRAGIVRDSKGFLKVTGDKKLSRLMGKLTGEALKRMPKGYEAHAEAPFAEALKLKQMYWYVELPAAVALGAGVLKEVTTRFAAMAEALGWMNGVLLAARAAGGGEEEGRPVRPEGMF